MDRTQKWLLVACTVFMAALVVFMVLFEPREPMPVRLDPKTAISVLHVDHPDSPIQNFMLTADGSVYADWNGNVIFWSNPYTGTNVDGRPNAIEYDPSADLPVLVVRTSDPKAYAFSADWGRTWQWTRLPAVRS